MKHTTEYLFDKPRSAYEPCITILASRRIIDAKALMYKLAKLKENATKEELPELLERYQAAEEALDWWRTIFQEE